MTRNLLWVISLLAFPAAAGAQEPFPGRAINAIVPFPPGGFVDITARPLAAAMEKIVKQPVSISNRPGAVSAVGTATAANAKPGGYTVLITASTISMVPEADKLFDRKPAYTLNQFAPIALIWTDPTYLVVRSESPWKSVKELGYNIEYYVWVGLFAPTDTPDAAMKVLRNAVNRSVEDPDFKATMAKLSTPVYYLDAPEFHKFWDRDAKRLAEVIRTIGRVEEKK